MKQFKGYDEAKKEAQYQGGMKLPVGAYVCKISNVRYEPSEKEEYSDRIVIAFDITEGEQKDFFKKQYESNTNDDKKWKGAARIYCPNDDGSESDAWTKKAFARWTNAFEKSNPGYTWDWDESKWKGKLIGIIFHEVGTVIDDKEVKYTEVSAPCPVEDAKNGTFWEGYLRFKAKNGYTGQQNNNAISTNNEGFMSIPEGTEEEIPF